MTSCTLLTTSAAAPTQPATSAQPAAVRLPGWSARLINWQRQHGRHSLPWQQSRDPYRVWLSEIMLQQTQVATVLGYYERFLQRFPTVADLAAAPLDDVLALWAGLGYYSRARNLHRCAQDVVARFAGVFPPDAVQLATLPGIGPSTAAAIAAFCFGQRVAILDGNVKRVLARALAYEGDLAQAREVKKLWAIATDLLPNEDLPQTMPAYTQAQMDLGATLCTPRKPDCERCPVRDLCGARARGEQLRFPVKSRTLKRSAQTLWLLWLRRGDGAVWLAQRPTPGVWACLFCLPLFDDARALAASVGHHPGDAELGFRPAFVHVLTHKDLHLHPVTLDWPQAGPDPDMPGRWVTPAERAGLGLPAPIAKLLGAAQDLLF